MDLHELLGGSQDPDLKEGEEPQNESEEKPKKDDKAGCDIVLIYFILSVSVQLRTKQKFNSIFPWSLKNVRRQAKHESLSPSILKVENCRPHFGNPEISSFRC